MNFCIFWRVCKSKLFLIKYIWSLDNQNYPKAILILQANFKFYDKWKFDNN